MLHSWQAEAGRLCGKVMPCMCQHLVLWPPAMTKGNHDLHEWALPTGSPSFRVSMMPLQRCFPFLLPNR